MINTQWTFKITLAAGSTAISTTVIMEIAYPDGSWPAWKWGQASKSARRWAEPVLRPRSRPLMWRAKPGVLEGKNSRAQDDQSGAQ